MNSQTAEKDAPTRSGYDWLLNNCGDLDKAEHTAHLDDAEREPSCFYCQIGEGWTRPIPPEVDGGDS